MFRDASELLAARMVRARRLPLVVCGARQVGKTWLVRDLAARSDLTLVECNFERTPELARCFRSNDPRTMLGELALALGRPIDAGTTLLFLDEIQAAGEVLAALRWFAEELPDLAVIAAGSLLEFTLADHAFSMPVGRVSYLHLEPLTFEEYLRAHGQTALLEAVAAWRPGSEFSDVAHSRASTWFERYTMVGGLPGVVETDVASGNAREVRQIQHDLVATYRDDFPKYTARANPGTLDTVLRGAARQLGGSFVYSHVADGLSHTRARTALELLERARICHVVRHTAANGIPLGGEVKSRSRKVVLLDVGLAQALLGVPATTVFPALADLAPALRGALTEQMIAQGLRAQFEPWEEPRLYYWQRGGGRPGEIDFVTQIGTTVVPIEAKAGSAGAMKSLHQFMLEKRLQIAVRLDSNPPSVQTIDVKTTKGEPVTYRLLSLPHYMLGQLHSVFDAL